ncbi:MAG: hypothetical protein EG826_07390 [Deltaproteobacteria bacterium]|nr:hypothetical protein [Deltaproteobacteria bacterium]
MNHTLTDIARRALIGMAVLSLTGCSHTMIQKQLVADVPQDRYERIIRLANPEGQPDRTLAGIVHVIGRATVCTDYPREEIIRSLDDLPVMEKKAYTYFDHYAIWDRGDTQGYVSLQIGYQAFIWLNDKDPQCRYKVQIILPDQSWRRGDHDGIDKSTSSW